MLAHMTRRLVRRPRCCQELHSASDDSLRHQFVSMESRWGRYRVGYLDEGPRGGATVLAVHGAPGGATDFDATTEILVKHGVRVVAPNLPGTAFTTLEEQNKRRYGASTRHRAQFVNNFVEAINLKSVDLLIGHSLGGTPVMELAARSDFTKSVALFNAVAHIPHKGVKPYWKVQSFVWCMDAPILSLLTRAKVKSIFGKYGFKETNAEHLEMATRTQGRLQFSRVKKFTETVRKKQLPVLYVTCKNDRLLEWQIPVAAAQLAGVNGADISYFDDLGNLTEGPDGDEVLPRRALVFARGGHHAHLNHAGLVSKCLLDIIHHVRQ